MPGPILHIDLEKIEANTRAITALCRQHSINLTGVTKATCGLPQAASAMIKGGVESIGESRLENIHRLRANGIACPIMLLRIPPLSLVDEIVRSVDISLNSELPVIKAISEAAEKRGVVHEIILMVDLGDLREGIWPDDLIPFTREVVELPSVKIVGLGTNLTCYGGVIPSTENMTALVTYARRLEKLFGLSLKYISGGNSSSLPLLASGGMPEGINHLRIGEAILLGKETVHRNPWPGTSQDAFILSAEVIELKEKPSIPLGISGEDAFGEKPVFTDRGERMRGILNIGREDVHVEGLNPLDSKLRILGASSDHLIIDVTDASPPVTLGARLRFTLDYAALLASMTSVYVEKQFVSGGSESIAQKTVHLLGDTHLIKRQKLKNDLETLGYAVMVEENIVSDTSSTAGLIAAFIQPNNITLLLENEPVITLGAMSGLSMVLDNFGLIWFDSEASLKTITGKHRKNEIPPKSLLSVALGYTNPGITNRLSQPLSIAPHLSPENIVLIGLREAAPDEAEIINRFRIKAFTIEDIDALGINDVMHKALRSAAAGTRGLYVRFNPDVLEGLGHRVFAGGLTNREMHLSMEMIARSGLMRVLDIACKTTAQNKPRADRVDGFILSCLGKKILGNRYEHIP
ncbi:MAG: alanine racemase [Spirochaetota bacterium]